MGRKAEVRIARNPKREDLATGGSARGQVVVDLVVPVRHPHKKSARLWIKEQVGSVVREPPRFDVSAPLHRRKAALCRKKRGGMKPEEPDAHTAGVSRDGFAARHPRLRSDTLWRWIFDGPFRW